MPTHEDLLKMLANPEGPFLERKSAGANAREIRQTVVAFANTLSEGQEAILFIGVRDDGQIEGCQTPDATQKLVRDVCDRQCYPPIPCRIDVLHEQGNVVAAVVTHDHSGPHFAGIAYVRRGSESVAAPADIFEELIFSRTSKEAAIVKFKREQTIVRVISLGHKLGQVARITNARYREVREQCKILACNSHSVQFQDIGSSHRFTEPLNHITISYDDEKWCPILAVSGY